MRILHLIPSLSGGGAERQLSYLAPELVRMGHQVHIAYLHVGPERHELPGVSTHGLRSLGNYDPSILWRLVKVIRNIKPTVIQTWIPQMDIFGSIAARITGVPWLFREPSSALAYGRTWKHKLRIRAAGSVAAIVSNSPGGDLYWGRYFPNKRRYVIRNGLPLDEIRSAEDVPLSISDRDDMSPMLLCVGRLAKEKNVDRLIAAIDIVRSETAIRLVICGDGPVLKDVKKEVMSLGLSRKVRFTGFLNSQRIWALMKRADIFCSLSDYEGSPNAVLEAMACGCPLVVSDVTGHRELLDGDSALFVDQKDARAVAHAISMSLSDKEGALRRARAAQQKAVEFSIPQMARQYEKVYEQAGREHAG